MKRFLLFSLTALLLLAACAPAATPTTVPAPAATATKPPAAAPTAAATAAPVAGPLAPAKNGYPNKPITILAPANAGGGWDQTSRLAQKILTGEKIVPVALEVTNKGGAGGTIGLAEFAQKKDPYTIMTMGRVMIGAILTNKSPVTLKETTPLARLTTEYEVISVATNSKYKSFKELLDDFKKDPKSITWGGGSAGGTDHILVGLIAQAVGVEAKNINYVAFAGGGEAATAIIGGQVTAGVAGFGEWKAQVEGGKMRFLAVSSDKKLPNDTTPTLKASGVDVVVDNWRGIVGSPGIDADTKAWLIELLTRMRDSKAWQDELKKNEWTDAFLTGDAFGKYIEQENETNAKVLKAIGLIQ